MSQNNETESKPKLKEENARFLLDNKLQDIRYSKNQQWYVLYLTFVAIAVITNIALIDNLSLNNYDSFKIFQIIAVYGAALWGYLYFDNYGKKLYSYRQEKEILLKEITGIKKEAKKDDINRLKVTFIWLTVVSLILSTLIIFAPAKYIR